MSPTLKSKLFLSEPLDTVVFPAFFLYRQFIELSLKDFIIFFSTGAKKEKSTILKNLNHNLDDMWDEYKRLMPQPFNDKQKNTNDVVEKYILEFSSFDHSSFNFRYPITKKLELIFGEEKRINLRHVQKIMQELQNYFHGVADYSYETKTKNSMQLTKVTK